jgi:hypothetical protein
MIVDLICIKVKSKNSIEINEDGIEKKEIDLTNIKIYEDEDMTDCSICLYQKKENVFYPCGNIDLIILKIFKFLRL